MKYAVIVTPEAEANLIAAFNFIFEQSPQSAIDWAERVERRIDSIERFPERCPLASEAGILGEQLRETFQSPYRILFRIEPDAAIVRVVHIRHAARRFLGESGDE